MNKNLKIRAWDKKREWMLEVFSIDFNKKLIMGTYLGQAWAAPLENCELTLYTYRNDKTGKEIYEGDIIKSQEGNVYFVEYERGSYLLRSTQSAYYLYLSGFNDAALQVIGDTYRNSELLKKD